MIRQVLSQYPLGQLSGVGMLLFLAVFAGALVWVYRKQGKVVYAEAEKLPLRED